AATAAADLSAAAGERARDRRQSPRHPAAEPVGRPEHTALTARWQTLHAEHRRLQLWHVVVEHLEIAAGRSARRRQRVGEERAADLGAGFGGERLDELRAGHVL